MLCSDVLLLTTSELRKGPGKSEVDNASWDCFRGRKQKVYYIYYKVILSFLCGLGEIWARFGRNESRRK